MPPRQQSTVMTPLMFQRHDELFHFSSVVMPTTRIYTLFASAHHRQPRRHTPHKPAAEMVHIRRPIETFYGLRFAVEYYYAANGDVATATPHYAGTNIICHEATSSPSYFSDEEPYRRHARARAMLEILKIIALERCYAAAYQPSPELYCSLPPMLKERRMNM